MKTADESDPRKWRRDPYTGHPMFVTAEEFRDRQACPLPNKNTIAALQPQLFDGLTVAEAVELGWPGWKMMWSVDDRSVGNRTRTTLLMHYPQDTTSDWWALTGLWTGGTETDMVELEDWNDLDCLGRLWSVKSTLDYQHTVAAPDLVTLTTEVHALLDNLPRYSQAVPEGPLRHLPQMVHALASVPPEVDETVPAAQFMSALTSLPSFHVLQVR